MGHLSGLTQDRRYREPDHLADSAEIEPAWSPDSRAIAYATKPKTGSSYEIELMDVPTRHIHHLTRNTPKELSNEGADFFARWEICCIYAIACQR